jgi:hypothetical protein
MTQPPSKRLVYATNLRCGICAPNWPPYTEFESCPACDEPTRKMFQEKPDLTLDEARSLAAHHAFNRYLVEHGQEDLVEPV